MLLQTSPSTVPGFNGAEAICNPVTTGEIINMGNDEFAADGALPQFGAVTIIQEPPPCPIPGGFSPGLCWTSHIVVQQVELVHCSFASRLSGHRYPGANPMRHT